MQTIDRPSGNLSDGSYRHELGWFHRVIATRPDLAPMVARLVLGLVMFPHGAQKALGWFGGPGFQGTLGMFTTMMHVPVILGVLAIAAEFLGSLGLITGLLGRIAAFGIFCNMLVATVLVHSGTGFFMNWMGNQKGEGFEYHLLAMGLALVVMIAGSGRASIDRMWQDRRELR